MFEYSSRQLSAIYLKHCNKRFEIRINNNEICI